MASYVPPHKFSLTDSHCHVDMVLKKNVSELQTTEQKIFQLCESLSAAGVQGLIHIASDDEAFAFVQAHKNNFAGIQFFYTIGQHPSEVEKNPLARIEQAHEHADDARFAGVGEVGLDYYYSSNTQNLQKEVFAAYVNLALELGKPVSVHTRDAHDDTLAILSPAWGKIPVVIHCFTGNLAQMKDYLNFGAYISFSGIVTFKNASSLQEAAVACPASRMLIETDAPFLAPVPQRGKTNTPIFLPHTFDFLCALRGLQSRDEKQNFARQIWQNTQQAFSLPNSFLSFSSLQE